MLWFLVGVILVLFLYVNWAQLTRESFSLFGREVANVSVFGDDTCPPTMPDRQGGLCYEACRPNYHGVGPACWADTVNVGIGVPVLLEPCDKGFRKSLNLNELPFPDHGDYNEAGLTCNQPLTGGDCNTYCDGNWSWSDGGFCHTKCNPIRGGNIVGRLNQGGVCPESHPEKEDGMCYRKCPEDKRFHMAGMRYLCYAGGDLSYGRGVGLIPSLIRIVGKYTFF